MAINFGDTIMEGSIEPTARVQQPVQDNSGAVLAEGLGGAAKAVGAIAGSIFKQGQEDANSKILTQYENDLLDLADAVDQKVMSRNEAMIKARNLRRQYLSNAPALQDDFDTVWSDFAGANGLGHVVIQGTQEEQNRIAMQNEAAKLGYTPEEFGLFQSRVRQATELNYQLTQAQNSGQLITETQKLQGLQAVVGVAQSAYPSAQRQINEAMAAIQANPNNKEEIATQLNNVLGNSIAQLKFVGGSADTSYITAPIEQAMTTFNQWVNGEVSNSVMEGELKSTQLKYELMYASDPTLGPVIAASKVIGEIGMQNSTLFGQLFTPEVIQKFGDMANPTKTVNLTDGTDGSARTSEAIRQSAGMITNDSDPELIQEINNAINQAVDSAYVHERSADGAMGFKDIVELLGSNEVGAFLSSHGKIEAEHAPQLVNILKNNYETELLPVINRAWLGTVPLVTPSTISTGDPNAVVGGMQNIPMNQLLEPRWNGNAVEFVPTEAYANNPRVIQLAADVTSGDNSIGIPLNNLINAYANVTGVDPKQIYEQDFAGRLFGQGAAPTPEELNLGTEPSEGEVDEVSSLVNEAVVNPDQFMALASVPESTANAAVAAIQSNFDLSDFNETPIDIIENVLAYANTNFNPASIVPDDQGSFDVIGTLRGTGNNSSHTQSHSHGEIDVKFGGGGVDTRVDRRVVDTWAKVQEAFGKQLTIVSGFRNPARNAAAGGAKLSQHMHGNAIDIETGHLSHAERLKLIEIASQMGFTGIGVYNNNLHFDMGGRRAWGPNYRGNSVPAWAQATINRHLRG